MLALRIIMPSEGDMSILNQGNGTIDLQPYFYGSEAGGPLIQVVDITGAKHDNVKVLSRFRLKVRQDGKLSLAKGMTAEEEG